MSPKSQGQRVPARRKRVGRPTYRHVGILADIAVGVGLDNLLDRRPWVHLLSWRHLVVLMCGGGQSYAKQVRLVTRLSPPLRCCCRMRSDGLVVDFRLLPRTSLPALQSAATIRFSGPLPITPRRHTISAGRVEQSCTVPSHRPRTCCLQELQQELGVQFRELLTWEPEPPPLRRSFSPTLACAAPRHNSRQDAETNGKIEMPSLISPRLQLTGFLACSSRKKTSKPPATKSRSDERTKTRSTSSAGYTSASSSTRRSSRPRLCALCPGCRVPGRRDRGANVARRKRKRSSTTSQWSWSWPTRTTRYRQYKPTAHDTLSRS